MDTGRRSGPEPGMLDRMARAIAAADGGDFKAERWRWRRLALAALGPLEEPTGEMLDAAYEAVRFDAGWAIESREDFLRALAAMLAAAAGEAETPGT